MNATSPVTSAEQTYLTQAQDAIASGDWPQALERATSLARTQLKASENKAGLFLEELDACCAQLAKGLAAAIPVTVTPIGFDAPANIYVVTEIYHSGGHSKLIEQMIAARPKERHIVLFTGALQNTRDFGRRAIVEAGGFPIYPDAALDHFDCLLWLREKLASLTGQRLFAFHHPEDVLAAVALAEFGGTYGPRAYMMHHADTVASVGVDLPTATHLAIRPEQREKILEQRPDYRVHVLPLVYAPELMKPAFNPDLHKKITADDRTFLGTGTLNTATCGGMHKFHAKGELSLPNALSRILMTTRGLHYHIGPVSTQMKLEIETALEEAGQALDRLVFVGEVNSVAETLVAQDVDLFLTSFPSGGGLTVVEAAYAGIPIAVYGGGADEVGRYLGGLTHVPAEVLVWETLSDLEESLRAFWLKDGVKRLEQMSEASRVWSDQGHSWAKFKRRFGAIVQATEGQRARALDAGRGGVADALVDAEYYLEQHTDVAASGMAAAAHFLSHGEAELRACNLLFDAKYYLAQLSKLDRKVAEDMPLTHYVMRGEARGYKPHPLFDPAFCKASFAAAGKPLARTGDPLKDNVLGHYLRSTDAVAPHMFFDPVHYAQKAGQVPDDQPLLVHFLTTGIDEMLSPHPLIVPDMLGKSGKSFEKKLLSYLSQKKPQLKEGHVTPLFQPQLSSADVDHYAWAAPNLMWAHLIEGNRSACDPHVLISVGHVEKMRPGTLVSAVSVIQLMARNGLGVDTHPLVSRRHILKQAPYAEAMPISLTQYFMENSIGHNIDPHPLFSTSYYLYNNPDLHGLDISPLEHFLEAGQIEGRLPHPAFNGNYYYQRFLKDDGGGAPLQDYLAQGMAEFRPSLGMDDKECTLARKMAAGLFAVGSDIAAHDMLSGSIHPDDEFKHPTLITETRVFHSIAQDASQITEIYPAERVLVNRPSVVAQMHIAPPIGEYLAPAATATLYPEATLVAGNDGFIDTDGCWIDHGLADFDPEVMLVKENGAVAAVSGDKVLLRRYASDISLPSGILASGTYSHNYFHFLLEILPRVLLAAQIAPADTPILADDGMPDQHYQMLRLYLPDRQILRFVRHSSVAVGRLYAGSMPNIIQDAFESDMPPADAVRFHPAVIRLLARLSVQTATAPADESRLWLQRDSAVRQLLNASEIETALAARKFDSVRCQTLPFSHQVGLFSKAGGGIVAQSGAHLANIIFAPRGTRVFALFSNAPGTNFYLWSALGAILGHDVVNIAGWRIIGTAPGRAPVVDESFTVPVSLVTPFFPQPFVAPETDSALDDARALLDEISGAYLTANTITSAWNLHSRPTPVTFDATMIAARRGLEVLLREMNEEDIQQLLDHTFFQNYDRNICSGYVSLEEYSEQELHVIADVHARFALLSETTAFAGDVRSNQLLALAILYVPVWKLPLVQRLGLFKDVAQQNLYLKWLTTPPYLSRKGEDAGYVAYTERLLNWLSLHLDDDQNADIRERIMAMTERVDMGWLLLVDAPLRPTLEARNTLLEHIAQRNGPAPRTKPRPADLLQGRIRVGLLCRTFAKGPDSEAVVAFFRAFDPAKYEIFAYSMAFRDRVVTDDADFDKEFDEVITHRRTLSGGAHDIREQILADDLDVFLYANATTFGLHDLERALYHRVAPIQMSLNSHLPISPGFPSFDYFVTGRSDNPDVEVQDAHHPETILRVEGPVINFLHSLKPKKLAGFNRATLGLSEDDVVLMNGGSSQKLRYEGLRTMLRALKAVPNGKLLLAPYNPGWAARSHAFAFNRQLAEAAQAVGVDMDRIVVLGELSVPEAEAAIALSDIYLSSFPHGGATMTHLSLIYGTPPVVLRREFTRSIDQFLVSTLGFNQMLANTPDDYVALVASLAQDAVRRKQLSAEIKAAAKTPPFVANLAFSHEMQRVVRDAVDKARKVDVIEAVIAPEPVVPAQPVVAPAPVASRPAVPVAQAGGGQQSAPPVGAGGAPTPPQPQAGAAPKVPQPLAQPVVPKPPQAPQGAAPVKPPIEGPKGPAAEYRPVAETAPPEDPTL